jgi:hypothetical protein
MLTSQILAADFSRGRAHPATRPLISMTHPSINELTQGDMLLLSDGPGLRRMRDTDFEKHTFHALG